ncbi:MAG: hypothetical protein QHJ81_15370 [Anaerolineae bacterium]|nr:hypothetical protein [Anaerolineae bacterium]
MIPNQHLEVLRRILACLEGSSINWAVTGSLEMALQGVPVVEVHDIDIQTDAEGAYEIERRLAKFVVNPVRYSESERMCSHLGLLEIDGIEVEIMGDVQKRLSDRSWEEPVEVERYRRWVEVSGMQVPVLSLEYEYRAYLQLGRVEKAELIRNWLQKTRAEDYGSGL